MAWIGFEIANYDVTDQQDNHNTLWIPLSKLCPLPIISPVLKAISYGAPVCGKSESGNHWSILIIAGSAEASNMPSSILSMLYAVGLNFQFALTLWFPNP